jgi:hypothetical protein
MIRHRMNSHRATTSRHWTKSRGGSTTLSSTWRAESAAQSDSIARRISSDSWRQRGRGASLAAEGVGF